MKCPECGVEAWIAHSRTEVLGDDSPDVQTEDMYEDYRNASEEGKRYLIDKWGDPF